MSEKEDAVKNPNHSKQIRDGLERAIAQGKKLGRPSIMDSKDDPQIAAKAADLRAKGFSWSQIASHLGIGRTTSRRLVSLYQNENSVCPDEKQNPPMPKSNVIDTSESDSRHIISSFDDNILGKLPKSFQIFSSLLEKAKKAQEKRGG